METGELATGKMERWCQASRVTTAAADLATGALLGSTPRYRHALGYGSKPNVHPTTRPSLHT